MRVTTNLVLDVVIGTAFLAAANPSLVGLAIHEWFGLAFAGAVVVHLVLHWEWIVAATKRMIARDAGGWRLNVAVDILLFVALTAAVLSGVMASRHVLASLGLTPQPDRAWREIHSVAANTSIVAMGVHLGLHWNWIALNLPRLVTGTRAGRRRAREQQASGSAASWPSAAR